MWAMMWVSFLVLRGLVLHTEGEGTTPFYLKGVNAHGCSSRRPCDIAYTAAAALCRAAGDWSAAAFRVSGAGAANRNGAHRGWSHRGAFICPRASRLPV